MRFQVKNIMMTADNPAKIKEYIQETLQQFKEDKVTKEEFINSLEEMMQHDIFSNDWVMLRSKEKLPTEVGSF